MFAQNVTIFIVFRTEMPRCVNTHTMFAENVTIVIVFSTEISRCVNTHTMFAQNVTTITIRFHVSVTDYYIYIYVVKGANNTRRRKANMTTHINRYYLTMNVLNC